MKKDKAYRKPVHFDGGWKAKATVLNGKIKSVGDFKNYNRHIPTAFVPYEVTKIVMDMLGGEYVGPSLYYAKAEAK